MIIRDYDPTIGQAFQGDILIMPVPIGIAISRDDEIMPIDGRLILQEGEVTGHHHVITLAERPAEVAPPKRRRTSRAAERLMAAALGGKIAVPTARLYRDPAAVEQMRKRGFLTRTDLPIGILIVEHGPMVVSHEEHDGIRLLAASPRVGVPNLDVWPGGYEFQYGVNYIGRQVESAGADERVVQD